MKRLTSLVLLLAATGCATSTMKSTPFYSGSERVYTGRVEDRVNLWPLAYYREPALSVIWPIFSQTDDHLAIRPIYSQYRQDGKDAGYDEFNFLWPICQFDTRHDEHRIFPLFWGDGHVDLFPLLWWRFDKSFTLFPLVWWKKNDYFHVLPLWWSDNRHKLFIPFYYQDATSFETPLFGWDRNDRSSWALPLYYKDHECFVSLPWSSGGDEDSSWWCVPPLLSWGTKDRDEWTQRYLLGLFGHERDGFTYFTPFVGVTHGEHRKGGWLWPLFGWTGDDRMSEAEAMMNSSTLDSRLELAKHESEWNGRKHQWHTVEGVNDYVHDSSWRLSGLSTSDRWISWSASDDGNTVTAKDRSDFGNIFAYKSESCREVTFDAKTREKLSDEENGESGLFCNLLWHSKHEASKGHEYDKKSILWRFWHYEKLNGDVTVDSFPFFTYDSKTNGYSKTSLCWRLFRNEYDPKTGRRAVDFLFIPVWR